MLVSGTLAPCLGNGKASHISGVGLRSAQSPQLNYLARISKAEGGTFFTQEGLHLCLAEKYSKAHTRNTPRHTGKILLKKYSNAHRAGGGSDHNIMQGESCTKPINLSVALPHFRTYILHLTNDFKIKAHTGEILLKKYS